MDITWGSILKIVTAGIITYVLLPAALVFRDMFLWKLINKFILNNELKSKIDLYVSKIDDFNKNYTGNRHYEGDDVHTGFKIIAKKQRLQNEINDLGLFIHRKSNFLNWLLNHYKQESGNPISEWIAQAQDIIKNDNGIKK